MMKMHRFVILGSMMFAFFGGGWPVQTAQAVSATGGNSTNDVDGYRIHTFTSSGTFEVTGGGEVEVLVVAGGGGGGSTIAGGGGAGGLIYTTSYSVVEGTINVSVGGGGNGGAAGSPGPNGANGTNSVFGSLTAYGGGWGAGWGPKNGGGGGSGGGGANTTGAIGARTNGQGNVGGASHNNGGGGGGGAATAGTNGTSTLAGEGGAGSAYAISGTLTNYAGGGGGGARNATGTTGGAGGIGGGGRGATSGIGSNGVANTGGGGGGGSYVGTTYWGGGAGGSGIVIVRYFNSLAVAANAATSIGTNSAIINGTVLSSGGAENPLVYFCWGDTDAETNGFPGTWAHADPIGTNWGDGQSFSTNLTGLISGSNYVYRCYATNSMGTAWSSLAKSFRVISQPAVLNPGPVNGFISTLLQGQVTDTGGETPEVWFYHWPVAGSVTTVVAMGRQSGSFSNAVSWLAPDTTYSYRILASNLAGIVWSPASNFQTLATSVYVSPTGNDTDTGTSWATAFATISNALAGLGDGCTIYLKDGIHTVGEPIVITNMVALTLAGGYVGSGSPGVTGSVPTIITRSVAVTNRIFSCYNSSLVFSGLTVSNGYVTGSNQGAGIWVTNTSLALFDCTFANNRAISGINQLSYGGGLYAINSTLQMDRCSFLNNIAEGGAWGWNGGAGGAGAYITGGRAVILNSTFRGNVCNGPGSNKGYGGGLYLEGTANHVVSNCVLVMNSAIGRYGNGGAVSMSGAGVATLNQCTIISNTATVYGGAVYMTGGETRNCLVSFNTATDDGGGIRQQGGLVQSCTIAQNTSQNNSGGLSMTAGAVTNSIVYFNTRLIDQTVANVLKTGGSFDYSCTTPAIGGTSNLVDDPQFKDKLAGDFTIQSGSACLDAGTNAAWMSGATDLSGTRDRILNGVVDLGCYEAESGTGPLACNFIAVPTTGLAPLQTVLTGYVDGADPDQVLFQWDLDDNGTPEYAGINLSIITNTFGVGNFSIRLTVSNLLGDIASVVKADYIRAVSPDIYVSLGGDHTLATNWATAYRDIQTALDASADNTTIHIAGQSFGVTNRLIWAGRQNMTLRGGYQATGPEAPGAWDPVQWPTVLARTSGSTRVMSISQVTTGLIEHVTITGGDIADNGAGIQINTSVLTLENCTISNNLSHAGANSDMKGGGIYASASTVTVSRCLFTRNGVKGENGTYAGTTQGGALYVLNGSVLLDRCIISSNSANCANLGGASGGGVYFAGGINRMRSCLIVGNQTIPVNRGHHGGGVYLSAGSTLENCTIVSNSITEVADSGAGVYRAGGQVTNCIIYSNWRGGLDENAGGSVTGFWYSCAPELTNVENGNITGMPMFVNAPTGDYRLEKTSPCINTGTNLPGLASVMDLDGNPRIQSRRVDMGAYECNPVLGTVFYVY